eukprot:TRINITY_DN226_c0_g1_i4.p3 TRINITY_DN226_c0_g1~~TRINITY_DN226_c0_g1_i4.p3  ORF type:complete len:189 (-),score=77.05 TRINITY_DN226_c0_g1_i4:65-631(-)
MKVVVALLLALVAIASAKDSQYQRFLDVTYRDFTTCHPDFYFAPAPPSGIEKGIVAQDLGADNKPVYAKDGVASPFTTGKANFDQWFNDVDGVNLRVTWKNGLTATRVNAGVEPAVYEFCDRGFFPIDNALFGNGKGVDFNNASLPLVDFQHNYFFQLLAWDGACPQSPATVATYEANNAGTCVDFTP